MLFVTIVLWSTSLLLLLTDFRKVQIRWLALVTFFGGCGGVAVHLDESVRPAWDASLHTPAANQMLDVLQAFFSLLNYYGLPYAFVLSALYFNPFFLPSMKRHYAALFLLIPPLLTFALSPAYTPQKPVMHMWMALWALPYILAGSWLIASMPSPNLAMRTSNYLAKLAILPPVLFATVVGYILPAFGVYGMWRYNPWFIGLAFLLFLVAMFKTGFLGVRLYIERKRLDSTLRAITSGTTILHHAIKNEIGKIRLFSEKMKSEAEEKGLADWYEDVRVIEEASNRVLAMIRKVQGQTKDQKLIEEPFPLRSWIEEVLKSLGLPSRQIQTDVHGDSAIVMHGDKALLTEALTNLCNNAMEAMPQGGSLTIRAHLGKRKHVLEISDTGIGMSPYQLKKAVDPFYTTKGGGLNFGLGLAYCYQVMQKHNGSLTLYSREGEGTRAAMTFPARRWSIVPSSADLGKEGKAWTQSAL
ncbi:sensor histidine kinase [Xylanibacillus composti]|uniref:histidine kinase n=1 Tax=Xylanibacillus composti TaxID=1572762 RepID=A0A8J4H577_9BACL|nr:HAMP domain-containing sensor histidine kinase [Xylanibacillus composti]MDT9727051.1 sensor histidine kinase [Xylanibacillus composti]GIQ71192.1 hypothetical protein XYCOK13_40160 [Xylanibacillus composti]